MLTDRAPQPHEAAAAQTLIKGIRKAQARTGQEWVSTNEVLKSLRAMHISTYQYAEEYDRKTKAHRLNGRLKLIAMLDLIDGKWNPKGVKGGIGRYEWQAKPKAGRYDGTSAYYQQQREKEEE